MTIPTLITHNQQKGWDTSATVFERKLGEALSIMNTQGTLSGYSSTEAFVSELSKHIKIIKTCSTPTDCFVKEIYTGDNSEELDMTKVTQAKNLNSADDYGTNAMGVMFANGVSGIIAYNPKCKSDPYSNQIISIGGEITKNKSGKVTLGTNCLAILYDVNGYTKPNKYTTGETKSDLRGINVALKVQSCTQLGDYCFSDFGTGYSAIDCSSAASTSTDKAIKDAYDTYCGPHPSGYSNDYWAGAKKHCEAQGMHLPTDTELFAFYNANKSTKGQEGGIPSRGFFWSSSETSYSPQSGLGVNFVGGYVGGGGKDYQERVLCLGD